jgi:predicted nucleic acid-binding protein
VDTDRPKFKFEKDKVAAFLDHFEHRGFMVATSPLPRSLRDMDDEPFLETAIAAQALCIVTGNQNRFPSELCRDVKVFAPADFLAFYKQNITTA